MAEVISRDIFKLHSQGRIVLSNSSFNVAHLNVESLSSCWEEFHNVVIVNSFDVIAITETFLKPSVSSKQFIIQNYDLIRNDRLGKNGGGVALYVKSNLKFKQIMISRGEYSKKPEYIFGELSSRISGKKVLIGVVYRPPKCGHLDTVFFEYAKLAHSYDLSIILGDFNSKLNTTLVSSDSKHMLSLAKCVDLSILPMNPTFHLPVVESWLDLIFVNNIDLIDNFGQCLYPGVSNHDLIYVGFDLKFDKKVEKYIQFRDFKNLKKNEFINELRSYDWESFYSSNDINKKVQILSDVLMELVDKYAPYKTVKIKERQIPWMNDEIREMMSKRDRSLKKYNKTKDVTDWSHYKHLRNRVKQKLRNSRNKYIRDLLSKCAGPGDFWKLFKKYGVGRQDNKLTEPQVPLDALNDHFCVRPDRNVDPDLIDYYENLFRPDAPIFKFTKITNAGVEIALSEIKSKARGVDDIPIDIIVVGIEVLAPLLVHIFNYSVEQCVYPAAWKKALVIPVEKKSTPVSVNDFRPISILCVFAKIFDKIIYKQFQRFIDSNDLLDSMQYGYRSNHSTQLAMTKLLDDVREKLDKKHTTILLLVDFSRAFDSVCHDLLLAILRSMNCSGQVVDWFCSYLSNRLQRIKTSSGRFSDWQNILLGVPQGSTLSALLFALYISRISNSLTHCKYILYADDLQLYFSCSINQIREAVRLMNSDLASLKDWGLKHGLKINVGKCKAMILGYDKLLKAIDEDTVPPVRLDDDVIPYESYVKSLGLHILKNLSWEKQAVEVSNKVFRTLYQLRKLPFTLSIGVKAHLISALVFPLFDYALPVYCDISKGSLRKLQVAQNACVRYVYGLSRFDHVTPSYLQLDWLKMAERVEYLTVTTAKSIILYKKPPVFYEKFVNLGVDRGAESRTAKCRVPANRTNIYNKSFLVSAIRIYNNLPGYLREEGDLEMFKNGVKRYFLNRY